MVRRHAASRAASLPLAALAAAAVAAVILTAVYLSTAPSAASTTTTVMTTSTSAGQEANLSIVAAHVSHSLEMMTVGATCAASPPQQGASYVEVRNSGTAPSNITSISFSYVDMADVTDTGTPTGGCTVGPGATEYVTVTGVGVNVATAGEMFTVSVSGSNGGFTYAGGSFA